MTSYLEKAYFTSYALPSIAVALSLVVVGIKVGKPIYQSHLILIAGLIMLFLPVGLSPIKVALQQVNPLIQESARTLGRGPIHTTTSITLPLIKRGLGMSFAIVFLVTMKELPAIMILSPLDFNTLTMSIWSYSTEAFFAQAAIPALMLILISTAPLGLLMGFSSEKLQDFKL
jgi:iron(III) transport system permease protein